MDSDINSDEESPIRHASSPLSPEDRERIFEVALERMVMIGGKVFGVEDEAEPEAFVDCLSRLNSCRALCCTYVFALTQDEVKRGDIKYNPERPYYMARDDDGYCPYIDRATFKCSIHEQRPLR
ncbi:MAG TPA: hypothetical protein VMB78_07845, partial [Dissulfurispiraceae bacterium]|nr:hypothetical protein [Dissulfurispiraceae bacterium]